jgi:hypothetical protein
MKKKQLTRKLSLNKQTLSQLDAHAMLAARGGQAATLPTDAPTSDQRTAAQCPGY